MKLLYVFPHPDDESFGPALAISKQVREGHEVHLLTLTRGGATKERERLGLSIDEMGEVRLEEMRAADRVLSLCSMEVLDYPDGALDHVNPLILERDISRRILSVDPDVVVTYPVHGISGHADHLVCHALVKGAFAASAERARRLAFFTLVPTDQEERVPLRTTPADRIGCAVEVDERDVETARRALSCYQTYRGTIERHDPVRRVGRTVVFELWRETHPIPLRDLTELLP